MRTLLHSPAEHAAAAAAAAAAPATHLHAPTRHGTLEGHVLPGVMFIVWGLWWSMHMLLRFKASHQAGGKPFRVASFFKAPALSWAPSSLVLLEPILKVFGSLVGVCDEVGPPYDPVWIGEALNHSAIHGLQHTLMYLSIAASGLADFARHWYPEIPAEVPSLFLATAFFSQGFILVFHLTGPDFDIRLHALLAFASFATAFSLALSGLRPDSLMACLLRCVCLLSLGSFWIQAGDLMFNRPAFDSVEGIAIAPALLCLHTAGWALLLLAGLVAVLPARGDSEAVVMREKLTREGAEAAGAAGKAHSHSHA